MSPDGRAIVHFAPRSEQPPDIVERMQDRWRVLRTPDGQEIARFRPPSFSGEGWRAAGQTMLGAHVVSPSRLERVALRGGPPCQILPPTDGGWIRPSWSPDGTRFAVVADGPTHTLELRRADGVLVRRVPLPARVASAPSLAWSPQGHYLAYRAEHRGAYVMVEAATGRVRTVDAPPQVTNFVWAGPATLRYVRYMSARGDTASIVAVRDVGADGTGDRLVREYRTNGGATMLTPGLVLLLDYATRDVQLAPLDGGPPRPFWRSPSIMMPAVSPDGRSIAVPVAVGTQTEPRPDSLYFVPMGGGPARVLATLRFPSERGDFALSPDGAHVLYNVTGAQVTHLMEVDFGHLLGAGPPRR